MTTAPARPAPACPSCASPLTGTAACPACSLPLVGPVAARLWEVDTALATLDGHRHALLAERGSLLAQLRSPAGALPTDARASGPVGRAPAGQGVGRQDWSPQRAQNLLLGLGALLLAVAATVFAAVTYDRLGVGGRAGVLLVLTAVAAVAAPRLASRGLRATAETVSAVALALAALDVWGSRRLGLGDGLETATWLALTTAVLAALTTGYAVATGLRLVRIASLVLAHAAVLLAVARLEPDAVEASLLLSLVGAGHLVALAALARRERTAVVRDLLLAAAVGAAAAGGAGVVAATVAAVLEDAAAPLALFVSAVLAAGAVVAAGTSRAAVGLAALPVPLLALAALVAARDTGAADHLLPLVTAAVATGCAAAAGMLGRTGRGAALGSLAVAALSLLAVAEHLVAGLLGPLGWAADPWSLTAGATARDALAPGLSWDGTAAVVGVLALAAATAVAAGRAFDRTCAGVAVGAGSLLAAALLAPLAVDAGHAVSVGALLALAGALVVAAERVGRSALAAAVAPAALAAGWSLADRETTLVALPALALLSVVVAARPWGEGTRATATTLAGGLTAASVVASGTAAGLSADQVAALLLVVPTALVATARVLAGLRRDASHLSAALVALVAVALASGDVGWLSWTLAGSGLLALAVALDADRRVAAPLGALLLSASSWVRLADAGVTAPEPYVVPVALVALVLGHQRTRRQPSTRSMPAYGPGLALLLGPSLLAALGGTGLTRPLLLGAVALAVLLVGATQRLQAPLALGGGTLAVLALDLLGPYAAALPRWTALAAAGTLLVVVGATFEQRRREASALRERYDALR